MDIANLIGAVITILLGTAALLGLGVRYVLIPYLREQLVKPVQETHKQVTVNGGKSDPPTVLDRLHDVNAEVKETRQEIVETKAEVLALARMHDKHLEWSQSEVDRIWAALHRQAAVVRQRKGEK